MIKLLDIFLCGTVTIFELFLVIAIAMIIQLIAYQVFGFNIYKSINKNLNKLDKYLSEIF
jgi:Tfp pilus assembly protein FimT